MSAAKIKAVVKRQEQLASDIYSLVLYAPEIAGQAKAGQFVSVYSKDGSKLLPRPISLCEVEKVTGTIRLVYRVVGFGTKEFSQLLDAAVLPGCDILAHHSFCPRSRAVLSPSTTMISFWAMA